jgi:branched-subunit amino acid ABC-type transport system permease component
MPSPPTTHRSLFAELRRRNVLKVALAYVVMAWLAFEIAAIWLSTIGAPTAVIKTLAVLLILGFLLALYISWSYEATPQGMKRTERVSPDTVLPTWSRRKYAVFIITVALLAAGLLVYDLVRTRPALPSPVEAPDH